MSSEPITDLVIPKKSDCVYTPCFCEENIWHLAKSIMESNKNTPDFNCYVIFLSNSKKCVHLWKQKALQNDGLTFWDYHVFLIIQHKSQTLVFDMDTVLPFPVPFSDYVKEAVRNDFTDKRYFRIVDAEKFLLLFSSDRGHMLEGEHWMSPPPPYPPILNEEKTNTFEDFISMDSSDDYGEVLDLEEFKSRFS